MKEEYHIILEIIRNKNLNRIRESGITSIIQGILYFNGWNVFDPFEVKPQPSVPPKDRPDLALFVFSRRKALIEIKKSNKNINNPQIREQLLRYLDKAPDVEYGILTNAISWQFYENETNQMVAELNLTNDEDSVIKKTFDSYLSKKNFLTPELLEELLC